MCRYGRGMPMSETGYRVVVTDQDNVEAERTIETGLAEYNREDRKSVV